MLSTKDKIQKSALKLFAKQGVKNTSTAQITKDAGVASGDRKSVVKGKSVDLVGRRIIKKKKDNVAYMTPIQHTTLIIPHSPN